LAEAVCRIERFARDCLARLGVPVPVEVDDLGGGSGAAFEDDLPEPPF
jgi:hypothetical protein